MPLPDLIVIVMVRSWLTAITQESANTWIVGVYRLRPDRAMLSVAAPALSAFPVTDNVPVMSPVVNGLKTISSRQESPTASVVEAVHVVLASSEKLPFETLKPESDRGWLPMRHQCLGNFLKQDFDL